jgi:pyruvate dehydrogenase E1 component alpha subunit
LSLHDKRANKIAPLENDRLKQQNKLTQAQVKEKQILAKLDEKEANEKIKAIVDESVKFSEESPWPDASELYTDVYIQSDYPYIRD